MPIPQSRIDAFAFDFVLAARFSGIVDFAFGIDFVYNYSTLGLPTNRGFPLTLKNIRIKYSSR
jgi:hypothetical protein